MNRYSYNEITVGHTTIFAVTITEKMMSDFYSITGDCNPLHLDDDFARESRAGQYQGRVAYGMLTASFMSTLAGVYLPGENSLIHKIEAEFPAPVYIGNVVTFIGEVIRKDDNFNTIEVKVTATNSDGQKVCRGKMRIGVLK